MQYKVAGDGASLVSAPGIDASHLADPDGLAFRAVSSEVFVANRQGANGSVGIISRFIWDPTTLTLTPNGTITGNNLNVVTQLAFSPVTGELFAANFGSTSTSVSRFTFDSQGNALPNGTVGPRAIGVNLSPDGKRLFVTAASTVIRQFDVTTGTELSPVTVPASAGLQQIALRGSSEIYVADPLTNTVARLTLDASDNPVFKETITGANSPIGVALSPDGLELFTGGHLNADVIDRYQFNAASDSWTATTKVTTPASLGYMLVLPIGS